jgi:hypothetical protein
VTQTSRAASLPLTRVTALAIVCRAHRPALRRRQRTSAGAVRQRTRTSQESGRSAMPVHIRGGANRADRY